jgi:hypothetical protein
MKIVAITFKELLVTFRDRAALVLMLVAPVALALVMIRSAAWAAAEICRNPDGARQSDDGEIGRALVDAFVGELVSWWPSPYAGCRRRAARGGRGEIRRRGGYPARHDGAHFCPSGRPQGNRSL